MRTISILYGWLLLAILSIFTLFYLYYLSEPKTYELPYDISFGMQIITGAILIIFVTLILGPIATLLRIANTLDSIDTKLDELQTPSDPYSSRESHYPDYSSHAQRDPYR